MRLLPCTSIWFRDIGLEWQGLVAKDKFYLTYHGDVLSPSMEEVRESSFQSRGAHLWLLRLILCEICRMHSLRPFLEVARYKCAVSSCGVNGSGAMCVLSLLFFRLLVDFNQVLTNALRYYLRKPETEEDSYWLIVSLADCNYGHVHKWTSYLTMNA